MFALSDVRLAHLRTDTSVSMHRTPSAAWKSENPCIGRRLLHGNRKIHASDTVCCMEIGKSMHRTLSAAWKSENPCIGHCLLHGNWNIHASGAGCCMEIGTSM